MPKPSIPTPNQPAIYGCSLTAKTRNRPKSNIGQFALANAMNERSA